MSVMEAAELIREKCRCQECSLTLLQHTAELIREACRCIELYHNLGDDKRKEEASRVLDELLKMVA